LDSFGSADRSKLAFRAPTTTVAEFDESEPDLWESWDAARKAQRRRAKRRKEKVDKLPKSDEVPAPTKPKVSQPAEAGSPPKLPKSVASARVSRKTSNTRVPIALASQVIDETEAVSTRPEPHQDVLGAEYSWIPEGTLTVWVPYANECRMVEVREGFWLGRMLVTQDDYTNVMGVNPSHVENRQDLFSQEKLPVNNVSWLDAVSYGKAMTNLAKRHGILPKGYEFRLPAEVEWEYACRAGTATDYYFGDDPSELSNHAWFRGNSDKQIHPVGQKQPNPWGLYDMYGNIREWVGNSFVNTLLGDSEQDEFRISRGGGYMKTAAECQSSSRSTNSLYHRFRNLGFRMALAKTPQPVKV
jgi:formylglycine-generating enzyme required for sulfatase activity